MIEIDEIKYTVSNLYAPNEDSPKFFNSIFKTVHKISEENVIIEGVVLT